MISKWVAIVGVSVLSSACGLYHTKAPDSPEQKVGKAESKSKQAKAKKSKKDAGAEAQVERPREVGDYFVHRFSGSYRQTPLTLTERVVAEEEDLLVVDYTLEEGEASFMLRARIDKASGNVVRVSQIEDDEEVEAPLSAYEDLLAKTVFAPDLNEELIDEQTQTCLVGPEELECETKNYRVLVGDDEAMLSVTQSRELPGRDISGEVTGVDGTIIYRAQLMEAGNEKPVDSAVAQVPEAYQE